MFQARGRVFLSVGGTRAGSRSVQIVAVENGKKR
jgi:hypothetical protein